MNQSKSLEEKLYEILGVLQFKKIVMKLGNIIRPNKEKIEHDNYFLTSKSLEGLKKYKKEGIFFNLCIHIPCLLLLLATVTSMSLRHMFNQQFVKLSTLLVINSYCVMLQRYNTIRINRTIKIIEDKQKNKTLTKQVKKIENIKNKEKIIPNNIESKYHRAVLDVNLNKVCELRKIKTHKTSNLTIKNKDKVKKYTI